MSLDVESLYRQYGDLVLGRCRTLLGNEADAQEMAQEIFLKLYRYRDSFRGDASPSTYLYRITTTTCLNKLRSRRRRPEEPVEETPCVPTEDSMLASHEVRDLVRRLLGSEDPKTQACVIYHAVDGMTYTEVGAMVGLSAAAVRKRISKFKKNMQQNPPQWLKELE